MKRADKEQVQYQASPCCFNCNGFGRPAAAGVVLGSCVRVEGDIHPADTCRLFQWAEPSDDDDGDGRPDSRKQHEQLQAVGTSFLMSEH
jgi:hypothetical protein